MALQSRKFRTTPNFFFFFVLKIYGHVIFCLASKTIYDYSINYLYLYIQSTVIIYKILLNIYTQKMISNLTGLHVKTSRSIT